MLDPQNLANLERKMKPKESKARDPRQELFRTELVKVIDMSHELVSLADRINWDHFDEVFGQRYHAEKGCSGVSRRLMVGWH